MQTKKEGYVFGIPTMSQLVCFFCTSNLIHFEWLVLYLYFVTEESETVETGLEATFVYRFKLEIARPSHPHLVVTFLQRVTLTICISFNILGKFF